MAAILCVLIVVAVMFPRALAFLPAATGFAYVLGFAVSRRQWPNWPPFYLLWMGLLAALMGISAIWSLDPHETLERTGKTGLITFGGVALTTAVFSLPLETLRRFACWFIPAYMCAGMILMVNLYGEGAIHNLFYEDKVGAFLGFDQVNLAPLNRSVMAFILSAPVAACCLFLVFRDADAPLRRSIFLQGVAFAMMVAAVLYKTDSQSAQLALVVAIFIAAAFPLRSHFAWIILAGLICGLIISAPMMAQMMFAKFAPIAADQSWLHSSYAAARMEIWDFVARYVMKNPMIGYGVEATRVIENFDSAHLYHKEQMVLHPHNFVLQVWIEMGALGAVFTCGFLVWVMNGIQGLVGRPQRLMLALFIACLMSASTSYGLWQGWWIGLFSLLGAYACLIARLNAVYSGSSEPSA